MPVLNITTTENIDVFFKAALDNSNEVTICLDNKLNIIWMNKKSESLFGWYANEVENKNFVKLCEQYQYSNPITKELNIAKCRQPLLGLRTSFTRKELKTTELSWDIIPILGGKFSINGFVLIGHILPDKISAKPVLESSNQFFDNLIAHLPGFVFWKDRESKYKGCNKKTQELFGLEKREDIIDKTDFDFPWSKKIAERFRDDDHAVIVTGESIENATERLPMPDGNFCEVLTTKVPLFDSDNNIIGILGTFTDITEQKRTDAKLAQAEERQRRAELSSRAKSNFLATMSHELRTPLHAVIGMTQILHKDKNLVRANKRYLDIILESSQTLLALIEDVLNFAKLEAGKLELVLAPFNLKHLITKVSVSMDHQLEGKPVKLVIRYQESIPQYVIGDQQKIRQILTNLLSNAIKFTNKGTIKIKVSYQQKTTKGGSFKISVEDTGIGIEDDKQTYIFDRFAQVESQYTRRYPGTGLGLSICKHLVEAMGGAISVESQFNEGSKFSFYLPLKVTEKPVAPTKQIETTLTYNNDLKDLNYRILVVEDNNLNQAVIRHMLEALNCSVDIASNSANALDLLKRNIYNLAFIDIGLPDISGIDLTKQIVKQGLNKHGMPIIALTAHMLEEDTHNCIDAGMDEVMTKPLMEEDLTQIIAKYKNKVLVTQ